MYINADKSQRPCTFWQEQNDSVDIPDGKGYPLFVTSKIYALKTMLKPSRSRNSPGDRAARVCAINNINVGHSLHRDNSHRPPAKAEFWRQPSKLELHGASGSASAQLPHAKSPQMGC